MKKRIAIIRYGNTAPLPKEVPIIEAISGSDLHLAVGVPFHDMGVISLVYTDWAPDQIIAEFTRVAEETGDILPVIVFDLDHSAIDTDLFVNVGTALDSFNRAVETSTSTKKSVELTLDDLLDLVNQKGMANLTTEELTKLQELSKK